MRYAKRALDGIALGDCFGETFFVSEETALQRIKDREIVDEPWRFTDDTVMSIGIYRVLEKYGKIDQNALAKIFAENYALDWHRGYGGTAHSILRSIGEGMPWQEAAAGVFDGMGSMGNGGAMRAAPIGAYFADDLDKVLYHARASAEVTHAHMEGIVGAMAAALGAALLLNKKFGTYSGEGEAFLRDVAEKLPESDTKYKIAAAASVKKESSMDFAVSVLGNGIMLTAQDTVPFCLWCAAHFYHSFEEALWTAVSALGDRDTICAIVGGMVSLYADDIPKQWLRLMERPEDSVFFKQEIQYIEK
ncbi:MAG: ADP-ribosylglycohydrolase family protein [Eubacterium sp.]|nr:ADP-ribosylglycohydrolase family protein [Eubacterium sp.]MCM1305243.1 ADP-ribosylglycohydrolase family protein [Butyrivibrio sp.]MCM1345215.1 ADP-ribosylglycohydrolase family protein [Muribaculaceae bacterium]